MKPRIAYLTSSLAGLFLFISASPLSAQEAVLELEPVQTRIEFTLGDVLHTVHGTFKLKQGTVRFDPATGKAGGLVVVDATSGDSGSSTRDRKMHKDILESQKYPEITITPVEIHGHIAAQGDSQVELKGIFKLHGIEHEMSMVVSVRITGDLLTADTHMLVPYVKWGLKNPSTFLLRVSEKVGVDIHATGHLRTDSSQSMKESPKSSMQLPRARRLVEYVVCHRNTRISDSAVPRAFVPS